MPVTVQKSTFTDPDDLLDKIRSFLITQGYTANAHAVDGTGFKLHLTKGSLYFNLRSFDGENPFTTAPAHGGHWDDSLGSGIALNGSDGYNGGNAWDAQPGAPQNLSGNHLGHYMPQVPTGTATYWFFYGSSPEAFYCIAEVSPDQYRYLGFGELEKFGTWTGGAFTMASYAIPHQIEDGSVQFSPMGNFNNSVTAGGLVRANYDSFDGWLGRYNDPTVSGANYSTGCGFLSALHDTATFDLDALPGLEREQIHRVPNYGRMNNISGSTKAAGLWDRMYNTANNVSILLPNFIYGRRLALGMVNSLLGKLPHCHLVHMRHLAADGIYAYGANNYRVVPTYSMNTTTGTMLPYAGLAFHVS